MNFLHSFLTRQWLGLRQPVANLKANDDHSMPGTSDPTGSCDLPGTSSNLPGSSNNLPGTSDLPANSSKSEEPSAKHNRVIGNSRLAIPGALNAREIGVRSGLRGRGRGFTLGTQCQLMANYLPNHCQRLETFEQPVFNGTYSNCGDLFLSSCQGELLYILSFRWFNFM